MDFFSTRLNSRDLLRMAVFHLIFGVLMAGAAWMILSGADIGGKLRPVIAVLFGTAAYGSTLPLIVMLAFVNSNKE